MVVGYADSDSDGYGDPDQMTSSCELAAGYVLNGDDCNDADPSVNPMGDEEVADGVDEDCDGQDLCY